MNTITYEEDLQINPLYLKLMERCSLLQEICINNWVVALPRRASFAEKSLKNHEFILAHILSPSEELPRSHFINLIGDEVMINEKMIKVKDKSHQCAILFEEFYYTRDLQKFKIICIDMPLNSKFVTASKTPNATVKNLQESLELVRQNCPKQVERKIDNAIRNFSLRTQKLTDYEQYRMNVKLLFDYCISVTCNRKVKDDPFLAMNMRIATEYIIMDSIYPNLFDIITIHTSEETQKFNKILKKLSIITLNDLNQSPSKITENLNILKIEILKINDCKSSLDKLSCIKNVIDMISSLNDKELTTTDELLPILVYLVIKCNYFHFIPTLMFIKEFNLSQILNSETHSVGSALLYILTTLEAIVFFIQTNENMDLEGNQLIKEENELNQAKNYENHQIEEENHLSQISENKIKPNQVQIMLSQLNKSENLLKQTINAENHQTRTNLTENQLEQVQNNPSQLNQAENYQDQSKNAENHQNQTNETKKHLNQVQNKSSQLSQFENQFSQLNQPKTLLNLTDSQTNQQNQAKSAKNQLSQVQNKLSQLNQAENHLDQLNQVKNHQNQTNETKNYANRVQNKSSQLNHTENYQHQANKSKYQPNEAKSHQNQSKNDENLTKIFKIIQENKEEQLLDHLTITRPSQSTCHPLCSCPSCKNIHDQPSIINQSSSTGLRMLHIASFYNNPKAVSILLSNHTEVNVTDDRGFTALHYAALNGHQKVLFLLMHGNADINIRTKADQTALLLASVNGHDHCVKALLFFSEHTHISIDINAQDNDGMSALHYASQCGFDVIIDTLLEYQAKATLKNNFGKFAVDYSHNSIIKKKLEDAVKYQVEELPITENEFVFVRRQDLADIFDDGN